MLRQFEISELNDVALEHPVVRKALKEIDALRDQMAVNAERLGIAVCEVNKIYQYSNSAVVRGDCHKLLRQIEDH